MALDDVYTEVLGEHSRNPDHKHHLSCATCALKGHNVLSVLKEMM